MAPRSYKLYRAILLCIQTQESNWVIIFHLICFYKTGAPPSGRLIADLMVIWDVRTRWNYAHATIMTIAFQGLCMTTSLQQYYSRNLQSVDAWIFQWDKLRLLLLPENEWKYIAEFERCVTLGTVSRPEIMDNPLVWWMASCVRMLPTKSKWKLFALTSDDDK